MTFRLTTPAVLSRSEVFRDETLRTDLARQEAGWATARKIGRASCRERVSLTV